MNKVSLKDIITFTFGILMAVIGYFINQRLASIDSSIKEFQEFQKVQLVIVESMKGEINLLKAKDIELEKAIHNKQ